MNILLIGLIYTMFITALRFFSWLRTTIIWFVNPHGKTAMTLKTMGQKKWAFIIGGLEHLIMIGSLLGATLLLF